MHEYKFYGHEKSDDVSIEYNGRMVTIKDTYNILSTVWCANTCAPRMRGNWTSENKTLGQCSITAFLVQDMFGGEVYGILREGGNYHCYNVIAGKTFDLTSEQFGDEVLDYTENPVQTREVHFAKEEKKSRYDYLKACFSLFSPTV